MARSAVGSVMNRSRTTRRIMELVGENSSELLHRLIVEIIEHNNANGLAALDAALAGFAGARLERAAGIEALLQLDRISRKARRDV